MSTASDAVPARDRTPLRVLVFIRCLEIGGAERQLVETVKHLDRDAYACTVASLYPGGPFRAELAALPGVEVTDLGKRGRWDWGPALRRAWSLVTTTRPDVIVGAFDVATHLTGVIGRLRSVPTVWMVGNAFMDFSLYDWLPGMLDRAARGMSSWPDVVVFNSEAGARHHLARGFAPRAHLVVPNPFDTARFAPDAAAGARVRAEWGIDATTPLVGIVARLDPIKDHPTFLEACALVAAEDPRARFVCVGDGDPAHVAPIRQRCTALGLDGCVLFAGARRDMPAVYNALDLDVLCSLGEGLPNVIGEAMASGVPCVVTDVGDCARLVGETGLVVPARSPRALADALLAALRWTPDARRARGVAARERVIAHYDARTCAARFGATLDQAVGRR